MEPKGLRCRNCGALLKLVRPYGDPHFECDQCGAKFEAVLMPGRLFSVQDLRA